MGPEPRRIDSKGIKRARYTTNQARLKFAVYLAPMNSLSPSHIFRPVVYHARNIAKPKQNFAKAYGAPLANCLSI